MLDLVTDMQAIHTFQAPDELRYGNGATSELERSLSKLDAKQAFLVTDQALVEAGVISPIIESLEAADVGVDIYDGVVAEPKYEMVEEATSRIRDGDYDVVMGAGGGSCMDAAKVASVLAEHDVGVPDIIGTNQVPGEGLPLILLPTTAGTGSEVTNAAVLTDTDDGNIKKVVYDDALFADLAIVDPALTETLPPQITASTGADALTHAIEGLVCTLCSPLTDVLCQTAIELIGDNLEEAVHEGTPEARYNLSLAATIAGLGFINSGLGAVHALTYPIGIEYNTGHGLANAIMLPYVMDYNVPAVPEKYAEVARRLGRTQDTGQSTADFANESVEAVTELLDAIDLPTSLNAVGDVERQKFPEFADTALEYSSHNIDRNPRAICREDAIDIFETALRAELSTQ